MPAKRFTPVRYQLKKEAAHALATGHPWIYRSHLSTAALSFRQGQWLKLVDHANEILGYGIFEGQGMIGVRVLKRGKTPPDREWLAKQIERARSRRKNLLLYTDAYRLLHGENDGLPGIVLDVYGDIGVLQTYSASVDSLGRYVGELAARELGLKSLIWKAPAKRQGAQTAKTRPGARRLRGKLPGGVTIREGKLKLSVNIGEGQKSGAFLDLRGLRKWIASQKLNGARVLNLFCYTGTLGLAAEVAGASEIWNVDISQGALDFAKKHHVLKPQRHRWIAADVFKWVAALPAHEKFDLIIVDPPSMASLTSQVPVALRAYRQIYRALLPHLASRGTMLACCCTSRIARRRFREAIDQNLGGRLKYQRTIEPEDDHPVGFPEGDYLKLLVYK